MEQILENPRLVLPKTNKNDIAAKIYDKVYAEMQVAKSSTKTLHHLSLVFLVRSRKIR